MGGGGGGSASGRAVCDYTTSPATSRRVATEGFSLFFSSHSLFNILSSTHLSPGDFSLILSSWKKQKYCLVHKKRSNCLRNRCWRPAAAVIRHYAQCCSSGSVRPCQIHQPTHNVTRPFQGETPWAGATRWVRDTQHKPKKKKKKRTKPPVGEGKKIKETPLQHRQVLPIGLADWHEINSTSLIWQRASLSIRRWDYWYSNQSLLVKGIFLKANVSVRTRQTLPLEPSQSSWNPSWYLAWASIVFSFSSYRNQWRESQTLRQQQQQ